MRAGSRLHFGLLSFGQANVRPFGGVGVMVDRPGLLLRVSTSDEFRVKGGADSRVPALVRQICQRWGWMFPPPCHVEVLQTARQHAGFGTGTQLSLAVAAALARWHGKSIPPASVLAESVGRARRSAVGTWGFRLGGLIAEGGHDVHESADNEPMRNLPPLVAQVELPTSWKWVLATPTSSQGLSGVSEQAAFGRLPPVPRSVTEKLCDELWYSLLPSAANADFDLLAASIYRYGILAGDCFAAVQGGPFAGAEVAQLVARLRKLAAVGVGQTSWGPTVFALMPNEGQANQLADELKSTPEGEGTEVVVASTMNYGAVISQISGDDEKRPVERPGLDDDVLAGHE